MAILAAAAAIFVHLTNDASQGPLANPMHLASDEWTKWECLTPGQADSIWGGNLQTQSNVFRRFTDGDGHEIWHSDSPWKDAKDGWSSRAWRGGWLAGSEGSLERWKEAPNDMAARWKEGEEGASLERTNCGWNWRGVGWLVWSEKGSACDVTSIPDPGTAWAPAGMGAPVKWWSGRLRDGLRKWPATEIEHEIREAGIPLTGWGTRWDGGGRFSLANGSNWEDEVATLVQTKGWDMHFVDGDLVVNGSRDWSWNAMNSSCGARDEDGFWKGAILDDDKVAWVHCTSLSDDDDQVVEPLEWDQTFLGTVRNHQTQQNLELALESEGIVAKDAEGLVVWSYRTNESTLSGGAKEVDVYANQKYQAMFCLPSGLHLFDVKGREVSGFPLQPAAGSWTAWALVDYDRNREYRYLLACDSTGRIENYRAEGLRTEGWTHQPADHIDVSSPVRHIEHLRLGNKDYIYVGRANGQVELLKRNGATRASTPVRVHASLPPIFRKGASLSQSSVLFLDESGWLREFNLESGEEMGISGVTRADRLEHVDTDGDGTPEIVTWLKSNRTVWDANGEPQE